MEITLTPDIESALTEFAQNKGVAPEMLVLELLRERFVSSMPIETATQEKETLADYLSDHIGVLSSSEQKTGGAEMSKECSKKFTMGMIRKRQEGRL